jgi:hypothetical protein
MTVQTVPETQAAQEKIEISALVECEDSNRTDWWLPSSLSLRIGPIRQPARVQTSVIKQKLAGLRASFSHRTRDRPHFTLYTSQRSSRASNCGGDGLMPPVGLLSLDHRLRGLPRGMGTPPTILRQRSTVKIRNRIRVGVGTESCRSCEYYVTWRMCRPSVLGRETQRSLPTTTDTHKAQYH